MVECATATVTTTTRRRDRHDHNQISFSRTQVLAAEQCEGSGFDRVSGIVTGAAATRSPSTMRRSSQTTARTALIYGTATVTIGANTEVTQFGSGSAEASGTQQISVGSLIDAFGTASASGRTARRWMPARAAYGSQSTASGLVTAQGATGGTLTLSLATLGGRSVAAFDFLGTGTSASVDASAADYQVTTGSLDLTNATVGTPVEASGLVTAFGGAPPDFTASTLLDDTTIAAELVVDWGAGTPAPFVSYDATSIVLDAHNSSIGVRHEIQIGAQTVDVLGIASDPQIAPNATATNTVFTIGHAVSGTFENFNTYASFITQLQTELNGSVFATGITALGTYTTATYTFNASSITLFLNN